MVRPAPRLNFEYLEDRVVPANFTINTNSLTISLNVGESLTVTDTGANTTFSIDAGTGNFIQVGGDPAAGGGAGTPVLVVGDAQLVNSLTINNAAAAANTNNTTNGVTFLGAGSVASTTISVAIADADANVDVDNISLNGLQLLSATGTVSLTTANGSITSNNVAANDVTASALTLTASALIGAQASPLQTTVANVEASSPGTNGINIRSTTSAARPDLTIGGASPAISGIQSGGPVSVVSLVGTGTGDLNVGEPVNAAGNISLVADGSVNVNAAVNASGVASTITVVADADNSGVGNVVSVTQGTITSAGGAISIGPGGVAMGGAQVVTIGGTVTVNGGAGSIIIAAETNALINAAVAVATGGTGGISVAADIDNSGAGDITTTATLSTAGGAISVGGTSPTVAQNVTLGATVTVNGGAGAITVIAENNVAVNAALNVTGTGDINIEADADNSGVGSITSNASGTLTTAGGLIIVGGFSGTGNAQNVQLNGAATVNGGAGGITVLAENNALINAPLLVTGTGAIRVFGDFDNSGTGDVVTNASGTINTAGGLISIGGVAAQVAQNVQIGATVALAGGGTGGITIQAENNVAINGAVTLSGGGTGGISVTADSDNSGAGDITTTATISMVSTASGNGIVIGGTGANVAQNVTIGAGVSINLGTGGIAILAENNVNLNASAAIGAGAGGITITADNDVNSTGNVTTSGTVSTLGGPIGIIGVNVNIGAAVSSLAGGNITIRGTSGTGGDVNIQAGSGGVTTSGGSGNILIQADADSDLNALATTSGGTGTITYDTDLDATGVGELQINGGGGLVTAGGNITIRGQDLDIISGQVNATTGATSRVIILTRDLGDVIQFGTEVAGAPLGLTDGDLDQITAGTLQVGSTATNTGGIAVTGTTSLAVGLVPVLRLETAGAISDATAADVQDDITVNSLALSAGTGVGNGDTLNVAALTNLAILNTTSGNVAVSNRLFSANGTVNLTTVDGLVGVANNGPGAVFVANNGTMNVLQLATAAGGGDIFLQAFGANADINLSTAGRVAASGGNGNVTLDTSTATSGGAITVNNTTPPIEIQAAGTGNIALNARDAITFAAGVTAQGVAGNIALNANVGNATGTADIVLQNNSSVRTAGNIVVSADQNTTATVGGGMVTMNTGTVLGGVALGARANTITIMGGEDVLVTTALATGNIIAASAAALNDDSVETTLLDSSAGSVTLVGGGRIGSAIKLTTADIVAATSANYLGMIDVAYATGLVLDQVNTLGNVQVRKVGGTLVTGNVDTATNGALIGAGNQLTLVSVPLAGVGGGVSVAGNFTLADGDLLIATAEGVNNIAFTAAGNITNNGPTSTSTLLAAGGAGAAITFPGPNDTTANFAGTNLVLETTGGAIGSAANPLEIDARSGTLSGNTTRGGATGGDVFLTDTLNGLRVGQINAGTTGNVTLNSLANLTPAGSNIVAATPNDGIAEVIGNVVNLNTNFPATAPATGAGGQIGAPGGLFFEVDANTLNATPNASNVWLSAVGTNKTTNVGSINIGAAAGTTAFLRTGNGATLASLVVDSVADVLAPTVNLSNTATGGGGNFGLSTAAPLEFNADILVGNLAGGGNLFGRGTATLGLTVPRATTTTGNIGIETTGALGNLNLGTATTVAPAAVSTGGTTAATATVTLKTLGSIVATAANPFADVAALVLIANAPGSIGTNIAGIPLETILGTPATPGTLTAVSTGGQVMINNNSPGAGLLLNNISASGEVSIGSINTAAAGEDITVNAGTTVSSTLANVSVLAADNLTLNGAVNANSGVIQAAVNLSATNGALTTNNGGTVSATGLATLTAGTALTLNTGGGVTSRGANLTAGTAISTAAAVNAGAAAASLVAGTSLTTLAGGTVTGTNATLTAKAGALSAAAAVNATTGPAALTAGTTLATLAGGNVTAGTGASLQAGTSLTTAGTVVAGTTAGLIALGGPLMVGGTVTAGTAAALQGTAVTNTAAVAANGGTATVTATAGAVNVNANVSGSAGTTIAATDALGAGQNVTIALGAAVTAGAGNNVTVNAGDNITIAGAVTTTGAGVISLVGDAGNADPGVGTTIDVSTATLSVGVATSVQLTGGPDADTFKVKPQAGGVKQTVVGAAPTTFPGDTLMVTGDVGTVLTSTGVGSGNYAFTNGGTVTFTGIESFATAAPIALSLDLAVLGFQNGSANPDVTSISTTPGGVLNITVQDNSTGTPVSIYSGAAAGVSSLTLAGSTDRDTVNIDETNPGLPASTINAGAPAVAPGDILNVNTTNATNPVITSAGGAGTVTFGNRATITFSGVEATTTAIVSIFASDATAGETGANQAPDSAQFIVTRQGDVSGTLTVGITIGGSAVNGVDYVLIPGSVTFAAGSATATVDIVALNNSLVDGTRTVFVTLNPGAGYTLAAGTTAAATIADNDAVVRRVATGEAVGGLVSVYDNGAQTPTFAGVPFPGYAGSVSVAVGDVNGDGIPDIVAVAAPNGQTTLRVFDGANGAVRLNSVVGGFGDATVAVGDVDGDGLGEIVIGLTSFPAFGIFNGLTGGLRVGVLAYPGAPVGVSVAVGDLDGDGKAEVITSPNGIAPLINVYNGNGVLRNQFNAFSSDFGVGATVAVGDLDGDGRSELIVGATAFGLNYVLVFNSNLSFRTAIQLPGAPATSTIAKFGPPIGAADVNGDGVEDVLVSVGGVFGAFSGKNLQLLSITMPFPGYMGGVFIG